MTASPTFQPIGVTVRRTARGALSCVPLAFPDEAILTSDRPHLCIFVDHWTFKRGRRAPRTRERIADLQAALDAHLSKRGVLTIPAQPAGRWTVDTLRTLIGTMIEALPQAASDKPAHYSAQVIEATGFRPYTSVEVSRYSDALSAAQDELFTAEVRIADASTAAAEWCEIFPSGFSGPWDASVDAHIRDFVRAQRQGTSIDDETEGADDLDDLDDLDPIERAARRTLHPHLRLIGGQKSSARPDVSTDDAFLAKIRRLRDELPRLAAVLTSVAEKLLAGRRTDGGAR